MPSSQDTAYPRLKSSLSAKELAAIYTPSPDELMLSERVTKSHPINDFLEKSSPTSVVY